MTFPPTSRYFGIETTTIETSDGRTYAYLRRRFVPQPERFITLQEHFVVQGDRIDNVTARYLNDPLQFWRVCDANRAMRPEELTDDAAIGRRIRITLPEGIPGHRMLKGTYLTLMIGPSVPIPAPLPVMEALKSVQVNSSKDRTGFQLTFTVGKTSPLQLAMLPAGYFDPMITRVVIIVTMNGIPRVLMDGIITRHEVTPSNEPGQSTFTVTGEDLSVLMDVIEIKLLYPGMPVAARVALILAKYAVFGIVPVVVPPIGDAPPLPTDQIPTQTGSDREYVKGLASQCGYVFYVEPGPAPLTSTAYFGPDVPIPLPQRALSVNMDWQTNVESLSFSLDGLAKKLVIVTILDPVTGKIPIPIPVPNVSFLHPPLGLRLTPPAKIQFPDDMANLDPAEALKRIFGLMLDNADAITGNGSLNTPRYGGILKTRSVVGVRGAGPAYDGFYYVNSVTHNIKSGEYKQSFTLSRDGLISQTPVVGP